MNAWLLLLAVWVAAVLLMAGLWVVCQRIRNASYVDVVWAYAVGASAIAGALLLDGEPARRWAVAALAAVWSARLGTHLFRRVHGKDEDGRYAQMRAYFGDRAGLAFFVFFQMQAVFVVVFAGPIVAAMSYPGPLSWRDGLGLLIGVGALVGETLADRQLAAFKRDPDSDGRVCKRGLWRVSRHPNYFFEWLHWFAYLAIGAAFATAIGWVALSGPAVMLLFLVFVTGIPHTERRAAASKGEAYRQYQRETSAFIPWFPKEADPA